MTKWPSLALKNQRGFTLTELLVSMGLSLFVLAGVGSCVSRPDPHGQRPGKQNGSERIRADGARHGGAGSQERRIFSIHRLRCHGRDYVGDGHGSITIQYDKNSNGACSGDDEIVAFAYDSANRNVTRNGVALSDGNVTAVTFTYYPQQTSSSAPAPYCVSSGVPSGCSGTLSSNYKTVQKITISLTVAPKSTDSNFTGSPVTMSLTADLRNHGV